MLDPRELATLIAIVDGQSFDNAARHLNISPGAVSQRIKSLENRLGSSVLIRSTPPRTTAAGKQVLSYARRMSLLQDEMSQALSNNVNAGAHSFAIAINHDSLNCWFMDVVSNLSDQPQLSFDIRTSNTLSTQELLKSGEVIAAITSRDNQVAGCKTRYLGQLEYTAVCSLSFFQTYFSSGIGTEQFLSAPVAIFDRNDDLVERFLTLYGMQTDQLTTHYIPGSHILLDAVNRGIGWTMLPKLLIEDQLATSTLVAISPQPLFVKLYWNTWEQASEMIAKIEQQVMSVAAKKLTQE